MFSIAGPVLVYGIGSSIIVGILYLILTKGRWYNGYEANWFSNCKNVKSSIYYWYCFSSWTKGRRWAFKKNYFDIILEDDLWGGQESFEKSESKIQEEAIKLAITNANLSPKDIEYLFSGDLLNQIISSSYTARQLEIPYFGLYGACSTMAESLSLGAMIVDGGFADKVVCATSSSFFICRNDNLDYP